MRVIIALLIPLVMVAEDWVDLDNPVRPPMRRGIALQLPQRTVEPESLPDRGILVSLSPVPKSATQRILGGRIAKVAMEWLGSVENQTGDPVSIAPSAVIRRVPEAYDHELMAILVEDGARNSGWARGGRLAQDVGAMAGFLTAARIFKIREAWPQILFTGAPILVEYFVNRFKGAAVPVGQNFERLAWIAPLQLGPGESANVRVFTAPRPNPKTIRFTIQTGQMQLRRSFQ